MMIMSGQGLSYPEKKIWRSPTRKWCNLAKEHLPELRKSEESSAHKKYQQSSNQREELQGSTDHTSKHTKLNKLDIFEKRSIRLQMPL